MNEIKFYKIKNITQATEKNSMFCVKADNETEFRLIVTDLSGNVVNLKDLAGGSDVVNTDGTITITGTTTKNIRVSTALQALINSALRSGDDISQLVNDVGYITLADIPSTSTGVLYLTSAENISSAMVVVVGQDGFAYKYDITNPNHSGLTCGITNTSATTGQTIKITLPSNIITDVGSGWSAGKSYYVATNSLLSETAPTTGIVKKIATGIRTDTVLIDNYIEYTLL